MAYSYFTYILTNEKYTTLYIGVTNNLQRRMAEHKQGLVDGFTKKYKVNLLVYFEEHQDVHTAIAREKQLKKWRRAWKDALIDDFNPSRRDLFNDFW